MRKSPSLDSFATELQKGGSWLIEGLWDATRAYMAALALQATGKSVIVITGGMREDRLFSDLSYFAQEALIEFPSWETLPGEEIAPSADILGKRFEALQKLAQKKSPSILLCPLPALLQKVVPKNALEPFLFLWKRGEEVVFARIPEILTELGYKRAPVVSDKGQFAMRGGIVDLFPVASTDPYRVEFFGDTIEQIKTFDPVGQKTSGKADQILLTPSMEMPLLQKAKRLCPIFDYLGDDPIFLWDDLLAIEDAYVALKKMPAAQSIFLYSLEEVLKKTKGNRHLFCTNQTIEELSTIRPQGKRSKFFDPIAFEMFHQTFEASRYFHPFQKIESVEEVLEESGYEFLFLNANAGQEEEMRKKLPKMPENSLFERGSLSSGYIIADISLAVIPNAEITQRKPIRRQKWRTTHHAPSAEFHELSPGDLVVHFHNGIGRYLGIEKMQDKEFLILQYAESSKLFVPLSQAHLVSRYIGAQEAMPSLSQLGSKRWQTVCARAQTQIVGYANDLLHSLAERIVKGGFRYGEDSSFMRGFEEAFPYAVTEDQILAIEAIKGDMMSERPMDRLICGDVGYGKTEVAMRAAFKAVADGGKQVVVLVPTTVLAMQHYETFVERMEGFPVRIGVISRFQKPFAVRETLEKTLSGTIDILVGTHRLLSEDVQWKDLGLVIIDEEQRFGVRAKEHLKKLKIGVDCLTLSATPIPRTLYMSLIHARDMSIINTPPQDRLPVKSILAETDAALIQNALTRELSRGGQAFFIHNRVETIFGKAEEVQKIVPSAKIAVVHGQMDAEAIDTIFHGFKQGDTNLLFATTIVENGIDIPNANTILIDRADMYGLADLYQLRGRVGRWNRSAYAYFLIPKETRLSEVARKRLHALIDAGSYGGGLKLAMRDLEIRGAGDILGVQQSGQVSAIGFHLYCKLLKRAIDSLKQKRPISFNEAKIEFPFDARLPEDFINEPSLRMEIYHRLGEASTPEEADALLAEIEDRFGAPPPPVLWLHRLTRIRAFASAHHFSSLKIRDLTIEAEQQKGKIIEKKTFLFPKKMQTLEAIESCVLQGLRQNFGFFNEK